MYNHNLTRHLMPYEWKNAIIRGDYTDLELKEIKELNCYLLEHKILFSDCVCHSNVPYPSFFRHRICLVLEYYYKKLDR